MRSTKNRKEIDFCLLIFRRHLSECKLQVFSHRTTYVALRSFEEIGAEIAEKDCLEKNDNEEKLDTKYNGRSSVTTYTEGDHK